MKWALYIVVVVADVCWIAGLAWLAARVLSDAARGETE